MPPLNASPSTPSRLPFSVHSALPHLAQEALALLVVNAHHFFEQAEIIAALAGHSAICGQILREARAAVAQARIQKLPSDARVRANALPHLVNVGAHRLA